MKTSDEPEKRKPAFPRKPKPQIEVSAPEPVRPGGTPVQFGPTKSAPGSRLKGGR
jgi:hypothetical protein